MNEKTPKHLYFEDLLQAQMEMGPLKKSKEASYGGRKHSYVPLEEAVKIIETCNKYGIIILQSLCSRENDPSDYICTQLKHTKTGYEEVFYTRLRHIPDDPEHFTYMGKKGDTRVNILQAEGSAITYKKRYILLTLFCIPTPDDDANFGKNGSLSDKQIKYLKHLFSSKPLELQQTLDHYGITKIEDLPAEEASKIITRLKEL